MDWEIRPIADEEELFEYARIQLSAYPAMNGPVENLLTRIRPMFEHDDTSRLYGVFAGRRMLGGMQLLDFQLNYFGRFLPAGGIGSVAVDFTEKKQGVAKAIVQFFIEHYQKQQAHLTLLYPFRPDFYQRMGYGFAPKMHQYSFLPASLPCVNRRHGVAYLTEDDLPELRDFSERYAAAHHGFCRRSEFDLQRIVRSFVPIRGLVGWKQNGRLRGYMSFTFRREHNFVQNSLLIHDWLWEGQEAFQAFSSFLHGQADQIHRVVYNTVDQAFHYGLQDVRNGSDRILPSVYHESNTSGVGLMYRITGISDFLRATSYRDYNQQTLDLRLRVGDSFRPANAGAYLLRFKDGKLTQLASMAGGVDLTLDISDLSALLMGSVDLDSLWRVGRAQIDPYHLAAAARLFRVEQRPECITAF
jgi:predicted acetyltransferase